MSSGLISSIDGYHSRPSDASGKDSYPLLKL